MSTNIQRELGGILARLSNADEQRNEMRDDINELKKKTALIETKVDQGFSALSTQISDLRREDISTRKKITSIMAIIGLGGAGGVGVPTAWASFVKPLLIMLGMLPK